MMQLDSRDIAILRTLASEGRITKAALADKVGLSPTPAWERLRKLERAGLIEGYGARFNLRKLGPSVTVFVAVELKGHTAAHFQTFERAVDRLEEVIWCWSLGGGFDYLMQVITTDIDSYQRLIDNLLEARVGLSRYYTYVVTKTTKAGGTPPFELIEGGAG